MTKKIDDEIKLVKLRSKLRIAKLELKNADATISDLKGKIRNLEKENARLKGTNNFVQNKQRKS